MQLVKGDITEFEGGAIVNPANSALVMGGGLAGIIRSKGGQKIEDEAVKQAPVSIGAAIITTAGALPCKFVIHAPTMKIPGPTNEENIFLATKAAIILAEKKSISVAFPSMGTGVGRVPYETAANSMLRALQNHDATIYLYSDKAYAAFKKVF